MPVHAAPATALPRLGPQAGVPTPLKDQCGRRIDYLRLSVTPACDLRCRYCRPAGGRRPRSRPLRDDQRLALIGLLIGRYGLRQIRLTGGEPLVYRGLVPFVARIRECWPQVGLAITTNGQRLAAQARALRAAGLDRINVSLDTLDSRRYAWLSDGRLDNVLAGLDAARQAGFDPPRINTVVLRGFNDDEVVTLAGWAIREGLEIRFLEAMPIGSAAAWNRRRFVPASEILQRLGQAFDLTPLACQPGETARRYRASGPQGQGTIGIIAPITQPFCTHCRRIRITADGLLYPCLFDDRFADLRPTFAGRTFDEEEACARIESAVQGKLPVGPRRQGADMVVLGG